MNTTDYLTWFDEVVSPTEPMFKLVEEGFLDWKPTERSFTIGQLICHIPRALVLNAGVLRQEPGLPSLREILISNRRHPSATVEEALVQLNEGISRFPEGVRLFTDHEFQSRLIMTPQRGEIPVWRFCAFVLEHHIHHLMELHLSLKILGLPVDTRSLYSVRSK